jgi:ABC-type transporter Mla subunit MlaD
MNNNERGMRFRIGIFVLSALLLLGILVMLFGRFPTIFRGRANRYYLEFDYAPGVDEKTPVRRSGVRVGQVEKVELNDATGKVVVTIVLDPPHVLYQGDQPTLVHGALSGDTTIDIVPPPERETAGPGTDRSQKRPDEIQQVAWQLAQQEKGKGAAQPPQPPGARTPIEPGTLIKGATQADVSRILDEMYKLTPPAREAFAEMRRTLESYDRMTPLMQETMREIRDLAKASRDIVPELRRTNDEILLTSRNWGKLGERLDVLLQTNQDKLVKTLDNFNETMIRVSNLFNEENQRNLAVTLRNVTAGSKNLESLSHNTDELIKESRQTVRKINESVTEADRVLANLQQATRPMADRSAAILKNLDESTEKLNQSLAEVRELLRSINQSGGSFRLFLSDPALYNNLNEAVCTLARALPRVDRILKDVEVFADKIARHPESLGVRGAVSPSAGLKESPTSPLFRSHPTGP